MAGGEYGRIVNVITGTAERGVINASAFAATQAGLLSLTRSLAVEWGRANIRVNALGTGWTIAEDVPPGYSRRSYWCGTHRCGGRPSQGCRTTAGLPLLGGLRLRDGAAGVRGRGIDAHP